MISNAVFSTQTCFHGINIKLTKAGGLTPDQIDYVVFYEKPFLKFDRLIETYLAFAPKGLQSFMMAMPLWLKTKLHLPREISKALDGRFKKRIVFTSCSSVTVTTSSTSAFAAHSAGTG